MILKILQEFNLCTEYHMNDENLSLAQNITFDEANKIRLASVLGVRISNIAQTLLSLHCSHRQLEETVYR